MKGDFIFSDILCVLLLTDCADSHVIDTTPTQEPAPTPVTLTISDLDTMPTRIYPMQLWRITARRQTRILLALLSEPKNTLQNCGTIHGRNARAPMSGEKMRVIAVSSPPLAYTLLRSKAALITVAVLSMWSRTVARAGLLYPILTSRLDDL